MFLEFVELYLLRQCIGLYLVMIPITNCTYYLDPNLFFLCFFALLFQSVSAFAPVANPTNCPWGQKAFTNYLGDNKSDWEVN